MSYHFYLFSTICMLFMCVTLFFPIVQLQGPYGRKKKKKEVRCCIMPSNMSYSHDFKFIIYLLLLN